MTAVVLLVQYDIGEAESRLQDGVWCFLPAFHVGLCPDSHRSAFIQEISKAGDNGEDVDI